MPISPSEFDFVRELVRQRSAIVLEPGKEYLVESRLGTVARTEGFASLEQFLAELRNQPANGLHARVVEAMTTNETTFFRDIHPFDALRDAIIPDLLQRRAAERQLTIWCAASSSGQEPYSIAMLLREKGAQLAGWRIRILGTDLSGEMIARAREARYSQVEMNRGLPAPLLVKYFIKQGLEWQLKDDIRQMVEYREMNLAAPWPVLPAPDIVFIRNVLIYFDVATKKEILAKIRQAMRPDGYLFLGGAETTLNLDDAFHRTPLGKATAYRLIPPAK
ncbi:MAG TPA: protein-glutamate O-methyltransferase CheR [Gemmatimonadales bacterium]|nr:protein-glutamate O-methyltransferase CheR [Gemmatimonadales bacterium]